MGLARLASAPLLEPSSATRVSASARGNMLTKKGAKGADNKLARIEPIVVKTVMSNAAHKGEKRAPAKTF